MLKKGLRMAPEMSRKTGTGRTENGSIYPLQRHSKAEDIASLQFFFFLILIRNENFVGCEQLGIEKFDEVKTFNFF